LFYFFSFPCFETGSYYVSQASLELAVLLPLPLEFWDYRCVPLHLAVFAPFLKDSLFSPLNFLDILVKNWLTRKEKA
jgi:hypothetical protein